MIIGDCMKRQVVSIPLSATVAEAAQVIVRKHVGTLPVVDEEHKLVGVIRLSDIFKVFLPDFVTLLDTIDFVHDFGALEDRLPVGVPGAARRPVNELMQPPVFVEQSCGLLRAFAIMTKRQLRDLPVTDGERRLVGIASHVDIAVAFLSTWMQGTSPT